MSKLIESLNNMDRGAAWASLLLAIIFAAISVAVSVTFYVSTSLTRLDSDVRHLQTNVADLDSDVEDLQINVAALQANVDDLQANVSTVSTDVRELLSEMDELKDLIEATRAETAGALRDHTHDDNGRAKIMPTNP